MLKYNEIYARKKEASGQVSTQTRSLALGYLAIAWALLTVHDDPLKSMVAHLNRYMILGLAAISVVVIIADLFQYVAITSMAGVALKKAAEAPDRKAQYDEDSFAYCSQAFLYHAKFWILGVGGILLGIIFILLFVS